MEPKLIESTGRGNEDYIYTLPNGKKVIISSLDSDFFEKLQLLPAPTKIQMMKLSDEEMIKYISDKKKNANKFLIELLERKWYYRESGDEVEADMDYRITDLPYTPSQLLKKCKSKRPMALNIINQVIEFYTGNNAEVYNKESN